MAHYLTPEHIFTGRDCLSEAVGYLKTMREKGAAGDGTVCGEIGDVCRLLIVMEKIAKPDIRWHWRH